MQELLHVQCMHCIMMHMHHAHASCAAHAMQLLHMSCWDEPSQEPHELGPGQLGPSSGEAPDGVPNMSHPRSSNYMSQTAVNVI